MSSHPDSAPPRARAAVETRQGPRERNEDSHLLLPEHGVFAVADGMGGLLNGHEASSACLAVVEEAAPELARLHADPGARQSGALTAALDQLVVRASAAVARLAAERGGRMGCTLTLAVVGENRVMMAHVGDSRAVLIHGGSSRVLTDDHSVAALRVRMGRMSEAEAALSPLRNRLYQAIGVTEQPEPDVLSLDLAPGDRLVLCSDGVWEPLQSTELGALVHGVPLDDAPARLVDGAQRVGLTDNATAVVVEAAGEARAARPVDVLRQCVLFSDVDERELMRLVPWLGEQTLRPGEPLLREGDPGDGIVILARGRLRVYRKAKVLVELGPGAHLGEIAMLLGTPRSASVSAVEEAVVYHLGREQLHELMRRRPILGAAITWRMAQFLAGRVVDLSDR